MCLIISRKRIKKINKPITVYKVYEQYQRPENTFYSPYKSDKLIFKKGRRIISDRGNSTVLEHEERKREIIYGFHCYTSLRVAKEVGHRDCIIAFTGEPKDFVAFGKFSINRSVVFNKLTCKEIIRRNGLLS